LAELLAIKVYKR